MNRLENNFIVSRFCKNYTLLKKKAAQGIFEYFYLNLEYYFYVF